jgi:alginate lyase
MWRKVLPALAVAFAVDGCSPRPTPTSPALPPLRHPGILVTAQQLEQVQAHVLAGDEPWKSAFEKTRSSRLASLEWKASPRAVVECGPYSRPDEGCREEKDDSAAAYLHALLWKLTGDARHARKSMEILNAWSAVVKDHTNHNAPLQSAWTASVFPRAAELLRHGGAAWPEPEIARFSAMLRDVYLPEFAEGSTKTNGNWELSMIEAMVAVGVFTDDRPLFERGVAMWRRRVPAYFYISRDGERPVAVPGGVDDTPEKIAKRWYGQTRMVDGLCQETCRDLGHTQYGLAAAINTAETAHLQGVDLYEEEAARLTAALELHAGFLLDDRVPAWLCDGTLDLRLLPTWEIAYNHYARRLGRPLPKTERLIRERVRTATTGDSHHILWETLTHGR